MRYHLRPEDMTPDEVAVRFRHFTREQLIESVRAQGLPDTCDDPGTLRAAAAVEVAAEARIAREQAGDAA